MSRKRRLRTRAGAPYLALELVDATGRVEARVWRDVELLDRVFGEGDAVRVLGRVERFGKRLQVDVRSLEATTEADPATLVPSLRRDADELEGFLEFLVAELTHAGLARLVRSVLEDTAVRERIPALPGGRRGRPPRLRRRAARAHGRCGDPLPGDRQLHVRLRSDLLLAAALLHDVGRTASSSRALLRQTEEGRLLGHVHLGLRIVEEQGGDLDGAARAELLHAIAVAPRPPAARTAEAAVLYHANQLDAQAATKPVGDN